MFQSVVLSLSWPALFFSLWFCLSSPRPLSRACVHLSAPVCSFCQSLSRSTLSCSLTRSLFLLDPQAQTRRPLAICLHEFHFKQDEAQFFQKKIILSRKKTVCSKNISFCQKKICLLKDDIVFSKWTFSKWHLPGRNFKVPTSVSEQTWICIRSLWICIANFFYYCAPWHSTNLIW